VPLAVTLNVAVCPAVTVWFEGCVVIVGATGAGLTVKVAALLVAVPAELLTTTSKVEPLSAVVVAGVV
jgi:Tfp pilus assembly ATPase PilU